MSDEQPKLRACARVSSPELVTMLEELLELARGGELIGVVALCVQGNMTFVRDGGYQPLGQVGLAYEDWRFQKMCDRNIEVCFDPGKI